MVQATNEVVGMTLNLYQQIIKQQQDSAGFVTGVYMKTTLVFEELYLCSCFGSLSEESAEQTTFLLQRNTIKC